MDHFFQQQLLQDDVFCYENCPVNQSAFVPYICRPWGTGSEVGVGSSSMEVHPTNMNKRMIELVKRSFTVRIETQEPDSKRCYQHMMSERLRRQKERNGYLALHSVLPHDTKKDKNSIILMAAKQIQELEMYKEMLKIRNDEIEERLAASAIGNVESTQIRIEVPNPTSRVDPMIDVLKCLKNLGSKTRSIRSQFSDKELVAVMEIETKLQPISLDRENWKRRRHFS
ncbi:TRANSCRIPTION FACTOR BHLH92 [Salix purpurea]|uniref:TRANSCRIPTION FACTOR BHLH92 n=1 Tax=Salix purpurea TaxID=77065 RepID=A0A9Q0Z959_SALPP|nr:TRANSCRIPTION FACTOR BHLH92 [Salix purpurea]